MISLQNQEKIKRKRRKTGVVLGGALEFF